MLCYVSLDHDYIWKKSNLDHFEPFLAFLRGKINGRKIKKLKNL